ncbi:MBL fold metallo-hydrolase [Streptomyces sp. HNM0575]|uniref:MBL fold metallo-hydrolase n=1 Tax=Streptomyces sp. HNM0575 TaxID=2716338 RepID=UPI00145EE786|nr:MBL fold metallo-hydrolase [Streptomyces sp. HNM0575]NLU73082.1 MBL fold metallo-hydrolase [Streptomyces sp. HNM0575]
MSGVLGFNPLSFGAEPSGERLARIERSPNYDASIGAFRNPEPAQRLPRAVRSRRELLRALLSRDGRRPSGPIPLARPELDSPPASGLRLTWLGHATVLAEIDGRRVLFDPVWGRRCSPFSFIGPRRLHAAPLPLDSLGRLDAVVISHDHYDHLDLHTIRRLAASDVPFAVTLGVGAHLERWGVPPERFTELDWHESAEIAGLRLTAAPARHFCGRGLRNQQRTLWASWAVAGPEHRIFHSGDTGYFPGFAEIGAEYGPFDATMIQIGAYSEFWPDIHMTPEEGLRAHRDLAGSGGAMLPIHWGTFNLAPHPWAEPGERLLAAAGEAGVRTAVPLPGGSFEPSAPVLPGTPWWRGLAGERPAATAGPVEAPLGHS